MSSSDQVNQEELPKPRLYTWITANDMREMIVNPAHTARKDYVVVDVRDSDRVGGHITNSVHSPSEQFHGAVDELVEANKDAKTVVFHCALSQQRGPKAARIYSETLQERYPDSKQEVAVLRGGFTDFQAVYRKDRKLVEGWKAEFWDIDALDAEDGEDAADEWVGIERTGAAAGRG